LSLYKAGAPGTFGFVLSGTDVDFLRGLSLFAGMSDAALACLAEHANRIDVGAGQVLLKEGDPAKEMLVVMAGKLEVIKRNGQAEACIATLGPGEVAGEMALIDIQPRSAEVRSLAAASVIVLGHADIAAVYREDQKSYTLLVLNIAREISLRLRRLDQLLADLMFDIHDITRGKRRS
jgi:CRP/FNR family transcriptional regulator, cyclic AMP receptor protein